jgi:MoaA/NifB/PqqE/SkfB family radical SAM enzyme
MSDLRKVYDNHAGAIINLQKNNLFTIYWSPDFFCNYSCSYCWPGSHSDKRTHLSPDVLISGLTTLKQKIKEIGYSDIRLVFAGGEPTLVPKFLELIEAYCEDQSIRKTLSINTNLTHGKNWWGKFLGITNTTQLSINASWHRESVGDFELARQRFLDVSSIFKSDRKNFFITIVVPPSQFDDVYSDALFFRKNQVRVLIRVERKTINGKMSVHPDYTDDMIDAIVNWNEYDDRITFTHTENDITTNYSDVEQAIALGKLDYHGWMCYAGVSSIVIRPNGDIIRGHTCIDKKIGNIQDAAYSLWSEPKKCITKKCGCSSDMITPKVK